MIGMRKMANNSTRRTFLIAAVALLCLAAAWRGAKSADGSANDGYGVKFTNVARAAGISHKTVYGDERKNKYLLETTGSGVAWFDYDNDGWLDLFFVNGTRLGGFPKGEEPTTHLYHNNRDGTFSDVTKQSGLARAGWGQSVCVGDYDNDGFDDLFISYYGKNALYKNNGKGAFTDVSEKAGVAGAKTRWGSGATFVDYDKDGDLDLFVANYIDLDLKTAPTPETGPCLYKGVMVACGPPGLEGGKNILYRNNGDGTFTDIGVEAGAAYSSDGKPQAGMGVGVGDYDGDGLLDIFKTNFSGDTSTLYRNLGVKSGLLNFDDVTFTAGIGVNTRFLGWGCGFVDFDNDGWLDIFLVNGHVYPEVEKLTTEAGYPQRKVLYQNQRNGSFKDVAEKVGGPLVEPTASRGCAFGDFDNDGDVDVAINPVNDFPVLLRTDSATNNNWISIKLIGVKSNRDGVGARIRVVTDGKTQIDEVRSGGSYYSQNDLRVHFGLGKATKAQTIEARWPSGVVDTLNDVAAGQVVFIKEGAGQIKPATQSAARQ